MASSQDRRGKEDLTTIQQNAILIETMRKEQRCFKPHTNFTINPFTRMYTITGKPNSFHDAMLDEGLEDEQMKKVIERSRLPPTQKNTAPVTSSQEYGWMTQPLLDTDRNDIRLNHPRLRTDVTKTREAENKLCQ